MEKVFSCKRCGFCCQGETTVSLDVDDQEKMLEVLKVAREEALAKYWKIACGQIQMQTINGHCIFYNDGCTVHKGRPWRCREWPLVSAILNGKENFKTIRSSCPGISPSVTYADICKEITQGKSSNKE